MTPVKSSMVSHVRHDPVANTLRVRFSSGDEYDYSGVTAGEHSRLMNASSFGSHFSKHIRSGKKSSKVEKK